MSRKLELGRTEAEWLVDLLEESDPLIAGDLASQHGHHHTRNVRHVFFQRRTRTKEKPQSAMNLPDLNPHDEDSESYNRNHSKGYNHYSNKPSFLGLFRYRYNLGSLPLYLQILVIHP